MDPWVNNIGSGTGAKDNFKKRHKFFQNITEFSLFPQLLFLFILRTLDNIEKTITSIQG